MGAYPPLYLQKAPEPGNTGYGGLHFSQVFLYLKPTQRCAQLPGTLPNEPDYGRHGQHPP